MDFYTKEEIDRILMNNLPLKMAFDNRYIDGKEIDTVECKWTTRVELPYADDMLIVKEKIFFKDGTTKNNLRLVKDFRRPYYVTKSIYRTYKQKKDGEKLEKLDVRFSTDKFLAKNINISLGNKFPKNSFGQSNKISSPYIYGGSIPGTTLLKLLYTEYYGDKFSTYNVVNMDIETHPDTGVISLISICNDNVLYTVTTKDFFAGIDDVRERILSDFDKYVPDFDLKNTIKRDVIVVDSEIEAIITIFKLIDDIDPDILAIWNISFDITHIEKRAALYNVKMEDLVHAPELPDECKFYKWNEGFRFIGRKPISPEKVWHTVASSARYKIVCAMRIYLYIRAGDKEIPGGVGLNAVLKANKIDGKLKFPGDEKYEKYTGKKWHMTVSVDEPVFYAIYNQYDILSMGRLDRKTKDVRVTFPLSLKGNDFEVFNSNPTLLMFNLYLYMKKHMGMILCS